MRINTTNVTLLLLAMSAFSPCSLPGDEPKESKRSDTDIFPRAAALELGIAPASLETLRKRAEESGSDAVVIVKDGRLVADWDFGRGHSPIEAMSATKSIVNLAIGRLVDSGKIKSLDQPVSDFYPEWKQGRKQLITVRHLLNHTSGLQNPPITTEIYASPDFVQLALAAELSALPGSTFSYNNKAVNLLAGLVQRALGTRMDQYIGKEIFEPLGITDFQWTLDRAGNPHGMSGLQIRAVDLARIGQMMLDLGSWKGKQVLSKDWIRKSIEPGQSFEPTCGLLWWLMRGPVRFSVEDAVVRHFKDRGMTPESVTKLEALKGKPLEREAFWAAIRPILHGDVVLKSKLAELNKDLPPLKPLVDRPIRGYAAQGYLGQHLVVIPRHRLVAVRQRRYRDTTNSEQMKMNFSEFPEMIASLADTLPVKP